ncbi:hypothetical protein [Adlercreutzia equolifaciens]|uniref:hypothetical protein n=1 Tax=Adlercreutzia equolifaciens TaxID=446660 RepID=UPI0026714B4D|nr:hypothetical protein [Adlercreutzia equolifaciens]
MVTFAEKISRYAETAPRAEQKFEDSLFDSLLQGLECSAKQVIEHRQYKKGTHIAMSSVRCYSQSSFADSELELLPEWFFEKNNPFIEKGNYIWHTSPIANELIESLARRLEEEGIALTIKVELELNLADPLSCSLRKRSDLNRKLHQSACRFFLESDCNTIRTVNIAVKKPKFFSRDVVGCFCVTFAAAAPF